MMMLGRRLLQQSARLRYGSTLAILEHKDAALIPASLAALTAAKQVGNDVITLVAGSKAKAIADESASKFDGISKVLTVENKVYDAGMAENIAPLLKSIIESQDISHVFAAHSAFGKSAVPRLAAMIDVQPITDIIGVEGADQFVRPVYAGNAIATVKSTDAIKLVTVRGSAFAPAEPASASTPIEAFTQDPNAASPTAIVSENMTTSDERPDLASAEKVVSGGRGVKDKEGFNKFIIPLADALGAAVGASRAAVDSGYADNALQVGQTGKVVAPKLYVAVGISGAIQHLAGMKDSKLIVAINKDAEAPIFSVADVGLVGDLFKVVPELTEKLKS